MFGSVTFTLGDSDPVVVEPTLGDAIAWEREHDKHVDELAEPRLADVAWLAWHAWRRSGDSGGLPFDTFAERLTDLEALGADPTPAAQQGGSPAS